MTTKEIILITDYLKGAYPMLKDTEVNSAVWYDMLAEYEYQGILQAIKEYIRNGNKFPPTIAEIITEYQIIVDTFAENVINAMADAGEFDDKPMKNGTERIFNQNVELSLWNREKRIEKAKVWVSRGFMPDFFKDLYEKYKKAYLENYFNNNSKRLEMKNRDIST